MLAPSVTPGSVRVIHGASDGTFALAGCRVAAVRDSLRDAFNIPEQPMACANGVWVCPTYVLRANDTLEFCKRSGTKSITRMFTQPEIRRAYTGVPVDVLDDLFTSLPHDDTNGESEPIWLESSVDGWLAERYSRRRADDGRDKVIPPSSVRIDGQEYGDLAPKEWRLIEALLSSRSPGVRGAEVGEVIDHVWGHDADRKENALKQVIKRLNEKLSVQGCPHHVSQDNGFVTISRYILPRVRRVSPTTLF